MQPEIKKICGDVMRLWPARAGVGNDKRDVVLPQQIDESRIEERFIANLDRVSHWPNRVDAEHRAPCHPRIAPSRQRERCRRVVRQLADEVGEALRLVLHVRRKLPQYWAELFLQIE